MIGKFVVLEGITSTGKTTQGKMIVNRLREKGIDAFFNHEPTVHSPFGRIVRSIIEKKACSKNDVIKAKKLSITHKSPLIAKLLQKLEKEKELNEIDRQLLYIVDRHEDLRLVIVPKIAKGITCVQDRYELSTYAFASTKKISYLKLHKLHNEILRQFYIKPDILLYFDLEPKISVDRLSEASDKPIDIYETLPKIKKTREMYIKLLKNKNLFKKLHIINAGASLSEVFADICLRLNI